MKKLSFILCWLILTIIIMSLCGFILTSATVDESIKSQDKIATNNLQEKDQQKTIEPINQQFDSIFKNFQINKNSIIKTHDSRSLGARYLNETELSSNEECMLWCWNTSNCNLAVFEEKTRGSCYLFDCGSLQDFKCRFSSHSFYTSSILQINRNSFLLNEWKSQASQENDLVGLKEKQMSSGFSIKDKDQVTNKIDVQQNKLETTTTSLTKVSKCRHYQFECRNNSECIAIYNVCDGIPQCPDGSDEATELECHKSRLIFNKNRVELGHDEFGQERNSDIINSIKSINQQQQISSVGSNFVPSQQISYGNFKDMANQIDSQLKSIKFNTNNLNYNYPKSANDKPTLDESNYRNRLNGDYNGYLLANWNQYSIPADKQQQQQSGLQMANEPNDQYNTMLKESAVYWPSFKYQPSSVDSFVQQQPQQQHSSLLSSNQQPNDAIYNVPVSMTNDVRTKMESYLPQQQQPLQTYNPQQQYRIAPLMTTDLKPHFDNSYNNRLVSLSVNVSNLNPASSIVVNSGGGQHLQQQQQKTNNNKTSSSRQVNYSHISSNDKMSIKAPYLVAISYLHDSTNQNGRETNSAVIALTLGLFITCILIVIVGCRMKSFKKRIARRGRSLAHDADYLINGMYL